MPKSLFTGQIVLRVPKRWPGILNRIARRCETSRSEFLRRIIRAAITADAETAAAARNGDGKDGRGARR